MLALYLSHPEVLQDPHVAVPQWGLSPIGRERAEALAARRVVPTDAMIFTSTERKARELAEILARDGGNTIIAEDEMGENDRSATGYLAPAEFEAMADRFFAEPEVSAAGWERAIDAQSRIVAAVGEALAQAATSTPLVFCGHGAVGTLLKCFVGGRAIARNEDQSRIGHKGGGNGFIFDLAAMRLGSDWMAFEDLPLDWEQR